MPVDDARRVRGERGAASSLTVALLTPIVVVLAFAAVQAAMWSHARTEARVVARDTAASVARAGAAPGDAQKSASAALAGAPSLTGVTVTVSSGNGVVTVTIRADAPGIIRGTSAGIAVTEAVPIEEVTPP